MLSACAGTAPREVTAVDDARVPAHIAGADSDLERDAEDRGFVPGLRLLDRSFDYLRTNPMIERATAVLLEF